MTETEMLYAQVDNLAGRVVRIMDVCNALAAALTHPQSPEMAKPALDAYRALLDAYPDAPPSKPRQGTAP
jgi:hypothetical protein